MSTSLARGPSPTTADPAAFPSADPAAEAVAQAVAESLMSPYCPGRSIASCPSDAARELEVDILAQARSGKSQREIEEVLVARFGEERVGSAFSPAVVAVTLVLALLAVVLLVRAGRRWAGRPRASPGASAGGSAGAARFEGVGRGELDRLEDALDDVDEF